MPISCAWMPYLARALPAPSKTIAGKRLLNCKKLRKLLSRGAGWADEEIEYFRTVCGPVMWDYGYDENYYFRDLSKTL
ncbi:protein of unknown function [Methylocaldum szegediense]|uniref:Uncharacterized protein n=1 Tax=Methylocaldum szegediense TaxID=73780 RepID=A0ABN8WY06_9GAMM|nr:protein of unknown function [Methylocaldum szegediense]